MWYHSDIMVKIQMDLSEKQDRIVDVFKMVKRLKTKKEDIKAMKEHFEVEIKPKNVREKEYFKWGLVDGAVTSWFTVDRWRRKLITKSIQ